MGGAWALGSGSDHNARVSLRRARVTALCATLSCDAAGVSCASPLGGHLGKSPRAQPQWSPGEHRAMGERRLTPSPPRRSRASAGRSSGTAAGPAGHPPKARFAKFSARTLPVSCPRTVSSRSGSAAAAPTVARRTRRPARQARAVARLPWRREQGEAGRWSSMGLGWPVLSWRAFPPFFPSRLP